MHKPVIKPDFTGELTVQLWPAYAQQGADQTVYAGTKATFSSYGYALDDGTAITAEWQYSTDAFDPYNGGAYLEWHDVKGSTEWGGLEVITVNAPQQEYKAGIVSALSEVNPSANTDVFHKNAKFHGIQTFLTVDKVDIAQHGTHFRVKYTAISSHGTKMEWYSNIADEKSGAWTTDTGMFGGDVSQSIKNNSNILNVKRPELEIITTPSALCGGAPYIDTMTPDEYGQMLLLSNAAATMANGTATYEAILYYKPGDLVPTPTWQYMTYTDHAPKFWADSTGNKWTGSKAQQLGVNVTVTNTDLGDALYQGQPGYKAIKSVMTISNVPASMYNPETLTKYYFRCIGVTTYTTVKDTYSMARVDKWGGFGDYFDANGYGPISCSALGIYARNNWCSDYNAWMSGVDDVYTYYGAAGNVAFNMSYEGHGTDYTGNYAVLYYLNVYDLTAAFGAGKEPDAAQCRTWFYGGSNPMANADYVASKTVTVGEQIITDVRHYAVEYDIPSLAFAVTDHSAEDETYIGTNAKYTPQPGDKTVTAIIDGNSKVYDGVQISPSAFTVYGAEGASESLFNITYTVEQGSYASYSPRTVNGSSWRDTGAVNAARYHAVAALTDAAIKAG